MADARSYSEHDIAVAIGERARKFRLAASLSQAKAAERAGVSVVCLREFERGSSNTTIAVVDRIARAIGVEILDLFNIGNDALAQFIELTRGMSEEELGQLEERVKAVLKDKDKGKDESEE